MKQHHLLMIVLVFVLAFSTLYTGYASDENQSLYPDPPASEETPAVPTEPEPETPLVPYDPELSIVMVGDSYTHTQHGAIQDPWPEQLQRLLGLPDNRFVISRKGTAGFAYGYRLRRLLTNVPPSESVTMVLVVGGLGNDLRVTDRQVRVGFREFTRIAHERFPNANLFYAGPHWSMKASRRAKLTARIPLYRKLCQKYGWVFLEQTTYTMHNAKAIRYWFAEDKHHPNQLGHDAIAKNIYLEIMEKLGNLKFTRIE